VRRRTNLPPLAECRDCAEPIRFVRMVDTGKALPVNPKPNHVGTVHAQRLRGPLGITLAGFVLSTTPRPDKAYPLRFTVHAATCEARHTAPKPAPAPAPTLF
jgi:hypothetical protein